MNVSAGAFVADGRSLIYFLPKLTQTVFPPKPDRPCQPQPTHRLIRPFSIPHWRCCRRLYLVASLALLLIRPSTRARVRVARSTSAAPTLPRLLLILGRHHPRPHRRRLNRRKKEELRGSRLDRRRLCLRKSCQNRRKHHRPCPTFREIWSSQIYWRCWNAAPKLRARLWSALHLSVAVVAVAAMARRVA